MAYIFSILFGIIEGITEWLPISSTGHMILLNEWIDFPMSAAFMEMFLVVIQLGAIFAVVLLFGKRLIPYSGETGLQMPIIHMWAKIIVACIPVVILELLLGSRLEEMFYNYQTVAIMLIVVGFAFLLVEKWNEGRTVDTGEIMDISYKQAFIIGIFQLFAALLPGTSRSGATIIGGLCLGLSRKAAAEFTFYLAIPVMFGASFLKIIGFGMAFTVKEAGVLITGMVTAFIVSLLVIRFLMQYVQKNDFRIFGWYRIVLGVLVIFIMAGEGDK